jgi:hypothetical protein
MGKPALVPLKDALRNPSPDVRRGAATSLAAMGGLAKYVIRDVSAAAQVETDKTAQEELNDALNRIRTSK